MKRTLFQLALLLGLVIGSAARGAMPPQSHTGTAAPSVEDPQSTFSLESDRQPVASLAGEWRFQPGDDLRWAEPGFDDSHWSLVSSSGDWDTVGYHHLDGTAWYRFHLVLPPGDDHWSLLLPVIHTSYQVFVDGQLVQTVGSMPPRAVLYRTRPLLIPLPTGAHAQPQILTVALRVWHDPIWSQFQHGGPQGVAEAGRTDLLQTEFKARQEARIWQFSDDIDLGGLELLAGLVAVSLFFSRRSDAEFLWFALLGLGLAGSHWTGAWESLHNCPELITDGVADTFAVLFLVAGLLFFRALFRGGPSHSFTFALVCAGLSGLVLPLSQMAGLSVGVTNLFGLLFTLPVYLWLVLFLWRHARARDLDARILRWPVLLLFAQSVVDELMGILETTGHHVPSWDVHFHWPMYFTLGDLIETAFLIAVLAVVLRRFSLRSREQDRVESELEAARSVQQVLVPETLPRLPGLSINTAYHPAQQVGGDFFQILQLPSGNTLIVIGDVAGKGLPAALQVSLAVGTLRALSECSSAPGEILAGLNRSLQGRGQGFTTCLAMNISPDRGTLTFANAGHIAPYVNGFELRTEPNLPLGLVSDAVYDEVKYQLSPGDHVTVLTDGVPEAMSHRELFGFERTGQLSRQPAAMIAETARTFGQTDDITVLTIDVLPAPLHDLTAMHPAFQPA